MSDIQDNLKKIKHIAVAGNIGAGKTTLSEKLSNHYGWKVQYEDTNTNPYLSDFYSDMNRWSFNLQVYFLNSRYRQVLDIRGGDSTIVQDRTIYEDANIFAPNLHSMGLMEKRDFENYYSLFKLMTAQIQAPDLLIYLQANVATLIDHIQRRGRDYEGSMSLDYLKKLNDRYEDWISTYDEGKLVIINVDNLDFIGNPADFGQILEVVDRELHDLFV